MRTVRKGARGREVRFLQIVLNTHLRPLPRLKADSAFGARTELAVRDFQKYAGLEVDGIVGPKTWRALLAPAKVPAPNLKKFRSELGTASDFVEYVRQLEVTHRDTKALLETASQFFETKGGARYLVISQNPKIIDFRHFFAAASEAYSGSMSRKVGAPIGGSRGEAMPLGVANELGQCVDEGLRSRLNSCFSQEDLGSNRLGAEFGRSLLVARSEARQMPPHRQLSLFLSRVSPKPPSAISDTQLPGHADTALESVGAIAAGIIDLLVPDAY